MISYKPTLRIFLANVFAWSIFLIPLFIAHATPPVNGVTATVSREIDGSPIEGASIVIRCAGGAFSGLWYPFSSTTDINGVTYMDTSALVSTLQASSVSCASGSHIDAYVSRDGYVSREVDNVLDINYTGLETLTDWATTAHAIDFTGGNALQFSHKITITNSVTSGPVTGAGISAFGASCIEDGTTGVYYCPILLADDDGSQSVSVSKTGYVTGPVGIADRAYEGDLQVGDSGTLVAEIFTGGTGAVEDPYQINSCPGILAVNDNLSASYVMTSDLDCSSDGNSRMIVNSFTPFSGTFDGAGHTITIAMNIGGNYVALFGQMNGATVKNLHLAGTSSGQGYVGALAGYALNSKIYYVSSSVNVTSSLNDIAGGLVGQMDGGFIKDSFVTGSVTGVNYVGGLVGQLQNGVVVQRSYADGAVTGSDYVGGFVGSIFSSTVTNSFSTGLVTASIRGGFAGMMGGGLDLSSNYFDATTTGAGATCAANGNDACHAVNSDGNDPGFFVNNLASAPAPFDSWDFAHIWVDDFSSAHSPLQNPITAPIGYWKLDENTGVIAMDSADGTHNAALQNSPTWTIGNFGRAVSFNGSDTYASTTLPWTNSGSISTWVYPTSSAAGASPAGWKLVGANNGYVLIDNGDGTHWRAVFTPDLSGATGAVVEDLDSIVLNQWSNIVMTWSLDAGTYTIHLYVNGIDQGSTTWAGTPGADGLGGFNIGRSGDFGDGYFAGKIDETKVYDYAIDQTVVSTLSSETPSPTVVPVSTVVTGDASNIAKTTATITGNVTVMTNEDYYVEYGVVYDLHGGDLNDESPHASYFHDGGRILTGLFTVDITNNLTCGTVYDYQVFLGTEGPRLYATNAGTFTTASCNDATVPVSSGRSLSGAKPVGVTPKTPVLFTQNMKVGTVGGEVMMLQKFLNAKSYTVTAPGKETNTFGGKTKKAVQKFQKDHGLKPDGSFGPNTRKAANDILIAEAK